jgi:hypothetical protein
MVAEVAALPAAGDVVLLGVQAQVVAQSLPGTLPLAGGLR